MPEEVITEEKPLSLNETINKVQDGLNPDGTVKEPEKTEKKDPPEKKPEETPADELSEEDLATAKNLMKALKDPAQAPAVIDFLAKNAGYTKAEVKEIKENLEGGTKGEKKEALDEITQLFTDQFGEEFAAKLAPAIKNAVSKQVEEKTKDIKETFHQNELERATTTANSILNKIGEKFYDDKQIPDAVQKEIGVLIETYPKAKNQSAEEWLNDLHALAAAKKGGSLKPVDSSKEKKINNNREDINNKLNGRRPSPSKENVDLPPAKNLDEAIARAQESLAKQSA